MLRIIGWCDYDDDFRPATNSDEEIEVLCKEIKEKNIRFCGDEHENHPLCTPVLSNGCKMQFSWRGWGAVMAKALSLNGDYDYALYYMAEVAPEKPNYPTLSVDETEIENPKEYSFNLPDSYFDEFRFYPNFIVPNVIDGKRIYIGDKIKLTCQNVSFQFRYLGDHCSTSSLDKFFIMASPFDSMGVEKAKQEIDTLFRNQEGSSRYLLIEKII